MPIGSPSARALVQEVESKIDFTVIPGISAIESKLDLLDLAAVDEMLSAIESKIDLTVIPGISAIESKLDLLDLADVDEMLSAIESKIDLTVIVGISAIESKLDQWNLADVDEMLSAIESKIDLTVIVNISAIESKLDANLPAIATILGLVDSTEAVGPYSYVDAGGEQDVYEDAVTTRRRIWVSASNRNMTQTGNFRIYRKEDGANYDLYIEEPVLVAAGSERAWDREFTTNQHWKITYEEDVDEGAARAIPYNVIIQVIE